MVLFFGLLYPLRLDCLGRCLFGLFRLATCVVSLLLLAVLLGCGYCGVCGDADDCLFV